MAVLLGAEAVHLEYPTKVVLDEVTLGLHEGQRVGIVGRNGDGKSSLLGLLTGRIDPMGGRVTFRGGVRVGVLAQRDDLVDDDTVGRAIVGDRLEHEWAGDPSIRDVITGLVSDIDWSARVGDLSGGQRRRTALAALLVDDWDVIALDEPTNHLDVEGIAWLAEHITKRWHRNAGGLLVITHDRWFLDAVCTDTWEVHDRIVEPFEGGYAAYVLQRVERDRIAAATEAKRQNLLRKELAWLRRGAPARTSKPKFRIEAANQLIADEPPVRDTVSLQRLAVARLGKDVVDLENVAVSFGDKQVLRGVTWRIAPGERTGILGANGAGKSTLLSLVCGTLEPTSGRVKHGKTVRVGLLDQQFSQLADISGDRVREVLGRTRASFTIGDKEYTPAQLLERLGFLRAHLSARVGELSGGQKRRLQLLLILLSEPNVLVLDEPTNDVDADMLAALEDLLDSWPGTLIVVSHDRYLIERVTDQQFAILDGTLRHLPGGIDQYLDLRRAGVGEHSSGASVAPGPAAAPAPAATSTAAATPSGLSSAERRALGKEIASIERRLARLSEQITDIHQDMADHDPSDYVGLQEHNETATALQSEVDDLEEQWLELSERLD